MDQKIRNTLALNYLRRTMGGRTPIVDTTELVDDGRKRKAAIQALVKAGYLTVPTDKEHHHYVVNAKAYDEVEAVAPSLVERYEGAAFPEETNGVPFSQLTLPEKKHVWEQHERRTPNGLYRFHKWDPSRHTCFEMQLDDPDLNSAIYESRGNIAVLVVSNEQMRAARATKVFRNKLDKLKRRHFAWGLVKAGILDEHQAEHVQIYEPDVEVDAMAFSPDPTKWEEELPVLADRLRARIKGDQTLLKTLDDMHVKMVTYGGWPKFLAAYEEGLVAEIRDHGTVKRRPKSSDEIDWHPISESEVFGFVHMHFDVNHAKETLKRVPHPITSMGIENMQNWISDPPGVEDAHHKTRIGLVRVDWKTVLDPNNTIDLTVPVISVRMKINGNDHILPIDGWSRIAKALREGRKELPFVILTEAEADSIRV